MLFMNILVTENVKYFWGYATEKDLKAFESESCIVSWSVHSIILWRKGWSFLNRWFEWEPKTLESMQ